jgi:hypothetical protein|tara:strand:- start:10597 stop:10800 length:204 start_codon:yes stop_codon:yes gene_type:complete
MSHEKSITVGIDNKYYNIPTVIGGKQLTDKKAVDHAVKSKSLGQGYSTLEKALGKARERSRKGGHKH